MLNDCNDPGVSLHLKRKSGKEHQSRTKNKNKFVDKNHLVISSKEKRLEDLTEYLYLETFNKQFGENNTFLHGYNPVYIWADYDSDYDDYGEDFGSFNYEYNSEYNGTYEEYFKRERLLKEKITEHYDQQEYKEIYKLVDANITTIKTKTDNNQNKQCSVCWTNSPNVRLKCLHEYCHECFAYNYFVIGNPKYCALCRSPIYGFATTRLKFSLLDCIKLQAQVYSLQNEL